jgi:hypothetical protein
VGTALPVWIDTRRPKADIFVPDDSRDGAEPLGYAAEVV